MLLISSSGSEADMPLLCCNTSPILSGSVTSYGTQVDIGESPPAIRSWRPLSLEMRRCWLWANSVQIQMPGVELHRGGSGAETRVDQSGRVLKLVYRQVNKLALISHSLPTLIVLLLVGQCWRLSPDTGFRWVPINFSSKYLTGGCKIPNLIVSLVPNSVPTNLKHICWFLEKSDTDSKRTFVVSKRAKQTIHFAIGSRPKHRCYLCTRPSWDVESATHTCTMPARPPRRAPFGAAQDGAPGFTFYAARAQWPALTSRTAGAEQTPSQVTHTNLTEQACLSFRGRGARCGVTSCVLRRQTPSIVLDGNSDDSGRGTGTVVRVGRAQLAAGKLVPGRFPGLWYFTACACNRPSGYCAEWIPSGGLTSLPTIRYTAFVQLYGFKSELKASDLSDLSSAVAFERLAVGCGSFL